MTLLSYGIVAHQMYFSAKLRRPGSVGLCMNTECYTECKIMASSDWEDDYMQQ